MCKKSLEILDHLLLRCDVARELLIMAFQNLGVEWVRPKWVLELLACCNRSIGQNDNIIVWNVIPSNSGAYGDKGTIGALMIKRE
jgi:hypothetical protein